MTFYVVFLTNLQLILQCHTEGSGHVYMGGGGVIKYTASLPIRNSLSEIKKNWMRATLSQYVIALLAQSVERPPHNREVVGSIPGRVIPKDVKRWELLLPCLALNIWKG